MHCRKCAGSSVVLALAGNEFGLGFEFLFFRRSLVDILLVGGLSEHIAIRVNRRVKM